MTDPDPKFVSQIAVPGQILGDKEHEDLSDESSGR